ncbi:hypothetical protein MCUN1_003712 [Malassezia cuniculi]|uniref:EH domain-containing protein n=1 Tax=Malassezia cuniculi TaxID=948313 RepID=A0AAF0J7N7_9BASI|nr:hypothetical protein MCUN1_003712 [Malassezia cuniculi]
MSDTPNVRALRALFDGGGAPPCASPSKETVKVAPIRAVDTEEKEQSWKEHLKEISAKKPPKEIPATKRKTSVSSDRTHVQHEQDSQSATSQSSDTASVPDPNAGESASLPETPENLTEPENQQDTQVAPTKATLKQAAAAKRPPSIPSRASSTDTSKTDAVRAEPASDGEAKAAPVPAIPPRPHTAKTLLSVPRRNSAHDTLRYDECFDAINVDGVVWPSVTRTVWRRSGLADAELSGIWATVAPEKCRGLTRQQFTTGLRLIDARLKSLASVRRAPPVPPTRP